MINNTILFYCSKRECLNFIKENFFLNYHATLLFNGLDRTLDDNFGESLTLINSFLASLNGPLDGQIEAILFILKVYSSCSKKKLDSLTYACRHTILVNMEALLESFLRLDLSKLKEFNCMLLYELCYFFCRYFRGSGNEGKAVHLISQIRQKLVANIYRLFNFYDEFDYLDNLFTIKKFVFDDSISEVTLQKCLNAMSILLLEGCMRGEHGLVAMNLQANGSFFEKLAFRYLNSENFSEHNHHSLLPIIDSFVVRLVPMVSILCSVAGFNVLLSTVMKTRPDINGTINANFDKLLWRQDDSRPTANLYLIDCLLMISDLVEDTATYNKMVKYFYREIMKFQNDFGSTWPEFKTMMLERTREKYGINK